MGHSTLTFPRCVELLKCTFGNVSLKWPFGQGAYLCFQRGEGPGFPYSPARVIWVWPWNYWMNVFAASASIYSKQTYISKKAMSSLLLCNWFLHHHAATGRPKQTPWLCIVLYFSKKARSLWLIVAYLLPVWKHNGDGSVQMARHTSIRTAHSLTATADWEWLLQPASNKRPQHNCIKDFFLLYSHCAKPGGRALFPHCTDSWGKWKHCYVSSTPVTGVGDAWCHETLVVYFWLK